MNIKHISYYHVETFAVPTRITQFRTRHIIFRTTRFTAEKAKKKFPYNLVFIFSNL